MWSPWFKPTMSWVKFIIILDLIGCVLGAKFANTQIKLMYWFATRSHSFPAAHRIPQNWSVIRIASFEPPGPFEGFIVMLRVQRQTWCLFKKARQYEYRSVQGLVAHLIVVFCFCLEKHFRSKGCFSCGRVSTSVSHSFHRDVACNKTPDSDAYKSEAWIGGHNSASRLSETGWPEKLFPLGSRLACTDPCSSSTPWSTEHFPRLFHAFRSTMVVSQGKIHTKLFVSKFQQKPVKSGSQTSQVSFHVLFCKWTRHWWRLAFAQFLLWWPAFVHFSKFYTLFLLRFGSPAYFCADCRFPSNTNYPFWKPMPLTGQVALVWLYWTNATGPRPVEPDPQNCILWN